MRSSVRDLCILGLGLFLTGCSSAPPPIPRTVTTPTLSPTVDALLMAHNITPNESLSVRLLGTVGPSGAYSLKDVPVSINGDQVFIMPNVRQAKEGNFIQMVIPLDHTLKVALSPGTYDVQVMAKQGMLTERVVVDVNNQRTPPSTRIELADTSPSGEDPQVRLDIQGNCVDGYIDRIEIRTINAGKAGDWQRAAEISRDGGSLACMITMLRGDTELLLQARAIDGQGVVDPSPASFAVR